MVRSGNETGADLFTSQPRRTEKRIGASQAGHRGKSSARPNGNRSSTEIVNGDEDRERKMESRGFHDG